MGADRLEVLGEAGRKSGRGIGAFKNSFEGGSGDRGFQCQHHPTLTFHISSHKAIFQ